MARVVIVRPVGPPLTEEVLLNEEGDVGLSPKFVGASRAVTHVITVCDTPEQATVEYALTIDRGGSLRLQQSEQ